MANMRYCRFQNTLAALRDCYGAMGEHLDIADMDLSDEERKAMYRLIKLCKLIAEESEI